MTKRMEVDVAESIGFQENGRSKTKTKDKSFGFQENGRFKPAKKKEYADVSNKQFLCAECNRAIEIEKKSFGEEIVCPDCGKRMIQNM